MPRLARCRLIQRPQLEADRRTGHAFDADLGKVPITVDVVSSGGTATAGSDYQALSSTLTFPAGTTTGATRPLGVTVIPDTLGEGNETVDLSLQNPLRVTAGDASQPFIQVTFQRAPLRADDLEPTSGVIDRPGVDVPIPQPVLRARGG